MLSLSRVHRRATVLQSVVGVRLKRQAYMLSNHQYPWHISARGINITRKWFSVPLRGKFQSSYRNLRMTVSAEEEEDRGVRAIDSTWNMAGLKKEVRRQLMRCHKKVGKAQERLAKSRALVEELTTDPNAALEDLEQCPNLDALELEVKDLKERLEKLNTLEALLVETKGIRGNSALPKDTAELALELEVDDKPPKRPERGPRKQKGPRSSDPSRLPYRRYYSFDNIEIRVGKKAEDNDMLTLSPEHRDGNDFWMHAAGSPGSHVVIRCNGSSSLPEEVVKDAAALAARQSKASGSPVVPVSMTKCRDIIKPKGAKAGLVQLTGRVRTVKVNMKEAQQRLERLNSTVLVN